MREKQQKHANSVMTSILHLAAIGSPTVQRTVQAILTNSMPSKSVTEALAKSGYAAKKHQQVIARKKEQNEARRRRATKLGIEPRLVDETSKRRYKAPLSNQAARLTCKKNWNQFLSQGKDIPPPDRPTNIKEGKVDELIKWVVANCQFRPGKLRNVRFK